MIANVFLLLLLIFPYAVLAQSPYTIQGKVDNVSNGAKIYLIYNRDAVSVTDSALVQSGNFTFSGEIKYPVLASLYLHKNPYVEKIEKGEVIDNYRFYLDASAMHMSSTDSLRHITISGSAINDQYAMQQAFQKPVNKKFTDLNNEFYALSAIDQSDSTVLARFIEREKLIMDESYAAHIDFAQQNPQSYLSLISLSFVAGQEQFAHRTQVVYPTIAEDLRNTPLGKEITLQIASLGKTKVGAIAPDLALATLSGSTVNISDYSGKYLLIDFWASWCGPCRAENPNLVNAYKKYKKHGFEILGISLDNPNQKDALLKAIDQDDLTWTQVSDFAGWDSHAAKIYGINAIPSNFLLDAEGRIVAKNLRGSALIRILEELFVDTSVN